MAAPQVVHGGRCVVKVTKDGVTSVAGVFSRLDYSVPLDTQGAWILGRMPAASIDYTGQELVGINAQGWRVVGAGAHRAPGVPKTQDLLTADYIQFDVMDRVTGLVIASIQQVRATQHSHSFATKTLSEMPCNYVGILASDEDGPQDETASAVRFPDG